MSLDYIDPSTPSPVDWYGPVFPEPLIYSLAPLWLFLLVLAVLGLLFYRQRLMDSRSDGRRAPTIIYREVRIAIDHALRATGPATIPAGERVVETVKLYLGPILAFSNDFGRPFRKLEKAVAGEAEEGGHGHAHHHAQSESAPTTIVVTSPSGGGDGVTTAERVQVIGPAQVIAVNEAVRHGGHDDHHETMSTYEQTAAVRYALERLHEFWTLDTIEPRLRAIHSALSICEPFGGVRRDEAVRFASGPRRRTRAEAGRPRL